MKFTGKSEQKIIGTVREEKKKKNKSLESFAATNFYQLCAIR